MTEVKDQLLLVRGSSPAPGAEDMDWTEPCLERGTTFSIDGPMIAKDIPISHAWIENEVLYFEGYVRWSPT